MGPQNHPPNCARTVLAKVQGGTGKHVDGSVSEPLQARPFQSLVHLSDPADGGAHPDADGSLKVLPGFHAASARYFQLADIPAPEGGFTPLSNHEELADDSLWVPARRLPKRWIALHAKGRLPPPSGAAQARTIEGLTRRLQSLAQELGEHGPFGPSEPPCAGDYTLWDPRLPHTTGEPHAFNATSTPRQVLYCAFMLGRGNEAHLAEQRDCRVSGRHMRWAPSAQRDDEMRGHEVAPLTEQGRQLYGYAAAKVAGRELGARDRAALTAAASEREEAEWVASCESDAARLLSDAHVAFFQRYGYVVVEGALPRELAFRVAADVRRYMRERHGLDVDDLEGTLSLDRLRRAFSPDGSGMIELYWLRAMEEARQVPALIGITRRLYANTWGGGSASFRTPDTPPRPRLHYYVDRTSMRLPAAALAPLLENCACARCCTQRRRFVIRIKVPLWAQKAHQLVQSQPQPTDDDVYEIEGVVGARKFKGCGWRYLVRWKGYAPEEDSYVSRADLCVVDDDMRKRLDLCEAMAKESEELSWVDEDYKAPEQDESEEPEMSEAAQDGCRECIDSHVGHSDAAAIEDGGGDDVWSKAGRVTPTLNERAEATVKETSVGFPSSVPLIATAGTSLDERRAELHPPSHAAVLSTHCTADGADEPASKRCRTEGATAPSTLSTAPQASSLPTASVPTPSLPLWQGQSNGALLGATQARQRTDGVLPMSNPPLVMSAHGLQSYGGASITATGAHHGGLSLECAPMPPVVPTLPLQYSTQRVTSFAPSLAQQQPVQLASLAQPWASTSCIPHVMPASLMPNSSAHAVASFPCSQASAVPAATPATIAVTMPMNALLPARTTDPPQSHRFGYYFGTS